MKADEHARNALSLAGGWEERFQETTSKLLKPQRITLPTAKLSCAHCITIGGKAQMQVQSQAMVCSLCLRNVVLDNRLQIVPAQTLPSRKGDSVAGAGVCVLRQGRKGANVSLTVNMARL